MAEPQTRGVGMTIGRRLEGQSDGLVGRKPERAVLQLLLDEDGPLVVFVHGVAGVGKSALVRAFAAEARARGAIVLLFDGGAIEPTERGFLATLVDAIGGDASSPSEAAARLAGLGDRVVLVLDGYEVLRPLDPWLRETFVPSLGDNVRLLLAGREPPLTGWSGVMGGLFRSLTLANLPRRDADVFLGLAGLAGADADRINRLAHGHPLSLQLAASAVLASPEVDREASTVGAMVEALTELYLARLDDPTRQALDAAAVVRRPTLSLLEAMLPEAAPQDVFERLRSLPFVDVGQDGLILHDTVREIVAAFLRSSDPDRSRRYRIAAWRQLRDEVARAPSHEMWRYTADLLYILENPMIREAFFPTTPHDYFVDAARPNDGAAIEAMTRTEEPASAEIVSAWWRRLPRAFRMVRDQSGAAVGFYVVAEMDDLTYALLEVDPVARQCRDHLRRLPVPRGRRVLFDRIEVATGADPAPIQAAILLDLKRMYIELRPNLRRVYTVDRERVTPGSTWAQLFIEPLPGAPVQLEGVAYHAAVLDFGPASVDGWLARVVASELQIEDDSILDFAQRQLVLDGRRIDLSKLEFEVLNVLCQHAGRVVERSSLLRDVWGYDHAGGSNVVESVIVSLRRKLGSRATEIETVRGVGYRFTSTG